MSSITNNKKKEGTRRQRKMERAKAVELFPTGKNAQQVMRSLLTGNTSDLPSKELKRELTKADCNSLLSSIVDHMKEKHPDAQETTAACKAKVVVILGKLISLDTMNVVYIMTKLVVNGHLRRHYGEPPAACLDWLPLLVLFYYDIMLHHGKKEVYEVGHTVEMLFGADSFDEPPPKAPTVASQVEKCFPDDTSSTATETIFDSSDDEEEETASKEKASSGEMEFYTGIVMERHPDDTYDIFFACDDAVEKSVPISLIRVPSSTCIETPFLPQYVETYNDAIKQKIQGEIEVAIETSTKDQDHDCDWGQVIEVALLCFIDQQDEEYTFNIHPQTTIGRLKVLVKEREEIAHNFHLFAEGQGAQDPLADDILVSSSSRRLRMYIIDEDEDEPRSCDRGYTSDEESDCSDYSDCSDSSDSDADDSDEESDMDDREMEMERAHIKELVADQKMQRGQEELREKKQLGATDEELKAQWKRTQRINKKQRKKIITTRKTRKVIKRKHKEIEAATTAPPIETPSAVMELESLAHQAQKKRKVKVPPSCTIPFKQAMTAVRTIIDEQNKRDIMNANVTISTLQHSVDDMLVEMTKVGRSMLDLTTTISTGDIQLSAAQEQQFREMKEEKLRHIKAIEDFMSLQLRRRIAYGLL